MKAKSRDLVLQLGAVDEETIRTKKRLDRATFQLTSLTAEVSESGMRALGSLIYNASQR
jgi:hypothetical protein